MHAAALSSLHYPSGLDIKGIQIDFRKMCNNLVTWSHFDNYMKSFEIEIFDRGTLYLIEIFFRKHKNC